MIRLCSRCKNLMDKNPGYKERVLQLIRHFCWLCPYFKDECGAIDGRTQDQLRDDIFKKVVLEYMQGHPRTPWVN